MIYLFTWNSDFLVKSEVKLWKNHFISKYWEFNLVHIKSINLVNNNFLVENITSTSFLNEKKLIIIDIEKELEAEKEDLLLKLVNKIPDNNILLFSYINPDKRNKFYKNITKSTEVEVKTFNTKDDFDLQKIISKKYWNKISNQWINTLIKYKSWNLNKIVSEIEKLLITFDKIDNKEVIENIVPELEESIFQIIDNILNKDIHNAIQKIDIVLNNTNIYAFYNNLIANLRTSIYIAKLKNLKKSVSEISSTLNLWNRAFLINKNYKISYRQLEVLYTNLVKIDKKMKSWKLNWTEEGDFRFELEKSLFV